MCANVRRRRLANSPSCSESTGGFYPPAYGNFSVWYTHKKNGRPPRWAWSQYWTSRGQRGLTQSTGVTVFTSSSPTVHAILHISPATSLPPQSKFGCSQIISVFKSDAKPKVSERLRMAISLIRLKANLFQMRRMTRYNCTLYKDLNGKLLSGLKDQPQV